MASDWYVRIDGSERGPVSSDTLTNLAREGKIVPDTQVKKGASGTWVSASRVKGLLVSQAAMPMPAGDTAHVTPPVPPGGAANGLNWVWMCRPVRVL